MTVTDLLKIGVYFLLILAVTKPAGLYMRRVFAREKTFLDPLLRPLERLVYRAGGVDETKEHDWIVARFAAEPGLTLVELHQELCARGVRVGYLSVKRYLKKEKIECDK